MPTDRNRKCAATACAVSPNMSTITAWPSKRNLAIETGAGVLTLELEIGDESDTVERVRVDMGRPQLAAGQIPVALPGVAPHERVVDFPLKKYLAGWHHETWHDVCGLEPGMTCVSMGNPHLILYCRDVIEVPLSTVGPRLERAAEFPKRINVHFVQVHSAGEVTMRTWERGSGITLACGTGASAVCVAGVLPAGPAAQILAHLPGGDLELEWRRRRACHDDRAGGRGVFGRVARR